MSPRSHTSAGKTGGLPQAQRRRPTPAYDRARDLPRLLALWPHEIDDGGLAGTTALVEKIRSALRQERVRGRSGHWCYDLNRHRALLGCYRAEVRRLANLRLAQRAAGNTFVMPRPGHDGSAFAARPETHLFREL